MKFVNLNEKAQGYEDILKNIIKDRIKANELKAEAKQLEDSANELFKTLSEAAEFDSVETNIGTLKFVTKGTTSFKKDKMKDYLLKKGVDSDLVKEAFEKATVTGESSYVGWFPTQKEAS